MNGSKNNKKEEINIKDIREFLKTLKNTDVEEFEWSKGDFHIRFVRETEESSKKREVSKTKKEEEKKPFQIVKSHGIGICHLKDEKGIDFVKENKLIKKGEILCKIESMKVFKDIKSPFSGKIIKILVKDKDKVDYGKELFYIEENV